MIDQPRTRRHRRCESNEPCNNAPSEGLGPNHGRRGLHRRHGEGPCLGHSPHHGQDLGGQCDGLGRRGRLLNQGNLRLLTLHLISQKPSHGYEIIKTIEDRVGGAYAPSPGVMYPTLALLEDLGHVIVSPDNGKKLHTITDEGKAFLEAHKDEIQAVEERLDAIKHTATQTPSPEIVRAMENLRLALQLRLARGTIDKQITRKIAELIDSITLIIEREC